jgi:hypothetical protein
MTSRGGDCADPRALARFYRELTGMQLGYDADEFVALTDGSGCDWASNGSTDTGPRGGPIRTCPSSCTWTSGSRTSTRRRSLRWRSARSGRTTTRTATVGRFVAAASDRDSVPTIMGEVRRHFRDHIWPLHVPRREKELQGKVRAATEEMSRRLQRSPTAHELATELDAPVTDIARTVVAANAFQTRRLRHSCTRQRRRSQHDRR